jgi:hypothetical protein
MNPGIRVGDVVQIDPVTMVEGGFFAGCLMIVTEVKSWGVQGYIAVPAARGAPPGEAYYRATWEQVVRIGRAAWVADDGGWAVGWREVGEVVRDELVITCRVATCEHYVPGTMHACPACCERER